jgi:hypothetical protein
MTSALEGDLDIHGEVTITGTVKGAITVHRAAVLLLSGVAEGGVVVGGGGFARIAGTTNGLFVAVAGQAILTGTCQGTATNDGGQLAIEGTVTGHVVELAGTTHFARTAVIRRSDGGTESQRVLRQWRS